MLPATKRSSWRVDLSNPVYVANVPENTEVSSGSQLAKVTLAEYREIEEKVERNGPFRRKQVARFNPISTIVTEKFSILNDSNDEFLAGRPVNGVSSQSPAASATQWVTLERRGSEWVLRPVVQWLELRRPAPAADDDAERKLREMKARESAEKRKFERRFIKSDEPSADTSRRVVKRRRAGPAADDGEGGAVDSAVAMQGVRDEEGAWEADEAFSDDDELVSDEEVQKDEEAVEVEDEELERRVIEEDDDKQRSSDVFANEISKIINNEKDKIVQAAQEPLFDEIPSSVSSDEESDHLDVAQPAVVQPTPTAGRQKVSKEEEIRLRLVDLFFRNEYTLDVAVVSKHFGFNRDQPEYKILYDAIKQNADLVGRTLHLKPHLRR